MCVCFPNKPPKTTSRFLSDFTLLGRHYTTGKQYKNGE